MTPDWSTSDRGISEVVSFVLVFALVTTSVGLVTTVGYSTLSDLQSSQQAENGALAFEVLSADIDAIESGRADTQSADIGTSDGTLGVDLTTSVVVSVAGEEWNTTTGSLFFQTDETRLTYESGAVVRRSGDNTVMLAPPDFTCTDDTAIVSVVKVNSTSTSSLSGSTVRVVTRRVTTPTDGPLLYPMNRSPTSPATVDVTVQSDSTDAWESYFQDSGEWTYDAGTNTGSCTADQIIVRKTTISVDFRV